MKELLDIVIYPTPVLRKKAAPVARITPEIQVFIERMADTMYDDHGVGLAAPQVGISLRIIVVDVGDGLEAFINPQIISASGEQIGPEGCLSLPNLFGDVPRADRVVVRGMNARGKKITITAEGYYARALQHEIDHLDGILFTDRVIEDTLHWITEKKDAEGNPVTRPTTRDEALQTFETKAKLQRV